MYIHHYLLLVLWIFFPVMVQGQAPDPLCRPFYEVLKELPNVVVQCRQKEKTSRRRVYATVISHGTYQTFRAQPADSVLARPAATGTAAKTHHRTVLQAVIYLKKHIDNTSLCPARSL